MIVMRLWRYLAIRRRSGQDHNIDKVLKHRRPESLTVRCPACPEVGFNIEESVVELSHPSRTWVPVPIIYFARLIKISHLHTLFISADGNFRLQRKRKNDDALDKSLNHGKGYFVNDEEYHKYLIGIPNKADVGVILFDGCPYFRSPLCRTLCVPSWRLFDSRINRNLKMRW